MKTDLNEMQLQRQALDLVSDMETMAEMAMTLVELGDTATELAVRNETDARFLMWAIQAGNYAQVWLKENLR